MIKRSGWAGFDRDCAAARRATGLIRRMGKLKRTLPILLALPLVAQSPFAWKDIGDGRMELREGGKPALVYNYGPQLKPGAPEDRRRCCYIFPLDTPAGVSMLDDFPTDHWRHRGLFWAWPVVETEGKKYDLWMNMTVKDHAAKPPARHARRRLYARRFPDGSLAPRGLFWAWPVVETEGKKYDLWMNMTVKDHAAKPPTVTSSAKQARMETENFWQIDGRDIVREDVRMTVFPAKENARELEMELAWQALKAPVTLLGSQEPSKSYGGFSVRFAARENTILRADGETLSKDEDLTPRKWAELEGVYGGKRVTLRITPDPAGIGFPYQWRLRNYGFVGASFPGRTAAVDSYTLEPGKPLTLNFRMRVTDAQ